MTRLPRVLSEWLIVTAGLVVAVVLAASGNWLWRLDLQLHDVASSEGPRPVDPKIVIVAVDDASLAALGRWPWPRTTHARLLDRLGEYGAAGVAMDVIFAEAAPGDELLAEAMHRFGNVVLPVLQREQDGRIVGEAMPVAELMHEAAALGHIQVEFDPDGLARSVYLWEGWLQAEHPQLGLALHMVTGNAAVRSAGSVQDPGDVRGDAGLEKIWQRREWLRIPFAGPPGSFRQVSYVDVLMGKADPALLRDSLVLVGATSLGLADSVPVPTSGFSRPMAGVEVHANVLNALRSGGGVTMASTWATALISVVVLLLLMVVLGRTSARIGLLVTFFSILVILLSSWMALCFARLWFGPSTAVLACLLAYPLWSWRRLEATQRYLDDELQALREESQIEPIASLDALQQRLNTVRNATRRSREAKRLIEDMIEHLPIGVVVVHAGNKVHLHNAVARRMLGTANPLQMSECLATFKWPESLAPQGGIPVPPSLPQRIEITTPRGTPVQISLSSLHIQPEGLVVGLVDLTEVRAAQQANEDTLRYVSHDLRAPLASIISLLDEPDVAPNTLSRLRTLAKNALGLADELFRLGRAEAADPARFEPQDLVWCMYEAADECWEQARVAGSKVTVLSDYEEALVLGNGELLRRAISNLISNALKYGGESGPVEVSLQQVGKDWEVSVRDFGPGIPEVERERLFQRFSRLPSAVQRGLPGIGLGLAMVKTVAERHRGSIRAEFPKDGGSRFVLKLPATHG